MQCLPEELVEERPGRPGFEGRPHLAEDLALAGHERVETGRDPKEVQRRRLVAQPVERRAEVRAAVAGEVGQRPDGELLDVLLTDEVELGPVARREHDRLAAEAGREVAAGGEVERDALAQLDRRLVVRYACEGQLHAKWVIGRTTATSAKPARLSSAARRPRQPSWRSTSRAA